MLKAQGIILSSPVFFSSATPEIKALIDRAGYLGIAQDRPFERKAGGAFVVGRRAGHNFVFMELLLFFLYHGMIIPGSTYWNVGFGKDVGEVMKDEEGIRTIRNFARNLSWLIIKGLKIELTCIAKSPLAPLCQRGVIFLPLAKGGEAGFYKPMSSLL